MVGYLSREGMALYGNPVKVAERIALHGKWRINAASQAVSLYATLVTCRLALVLGICSLALRLRIWLIWRTKGVTTIAAKLIAPTDMPITKPTPVLRQRMAGASVVSAPGKGCDCDRR